MRPGSIREVEVKWEMEIMLVTDIKKIDKRKYVIYINYEAAFALYNSEIAKYHIIVNEYISEDIYNEILNNVIVKRCRERAGYILGKSDKSEKDLRDKLKKGFYPTNVIDNVIEDFLNYGYLDDERYAFNYVRYNISSKSRNRIYNELISKGIDKDNIQQAFCRCIEECGDSDVEKVQNGLITKEFRRRNYDFESEDKALFGKITSSLLRKGFSYDEIMHVYNCTKKGCMN